MGARLRPGAREPGALRSPRGLLPARSELATAAAATSHRRGAGLGGQQNGPGAAGRTGGTWGRMARAAAAARAEAGRGDGSLSSPGTRSSRGGSREWARRRAARGRQAGSRAAPSAGELKKLAKK